VNALITEIGERQVAGFILVMGRVGPLFVLAPLFGLKMIPARARVMCGLALGVGLAPVALGDAAVPDGLSAYVELLLKEMLVGFAFAFAIGALLAALQVAGGFLDTLLGFSYGGLVDPISGVQTTVLANLYSMLGTAVFVAIGGDRFVIQGLARTYDTVPLTEMPNLGSLLQGVDTAFVSIFSSALEVVAPVVIAVTLTDAAFGLVSRVVPQLNVFAVGFSAKIAVGLIVLAASLPFMGGWLGDEMNQTTRSILGALRVG
jgi:flagellar biosynthesis protein FliR